MIFRRLAQHLREQNWTAIFIEFVLLVLGVFLGIQVANWNEARMFDALERDLLRSLRAEIETGIETTNAKRDFYAAVNAAGERALAFLESDQACAGDECWRMLVDLFHASQWIDVDVNRTTYEEMRRIGVPRSRELASVLDSLYTQSSALNSVSNERPAYRTLVRGLIPVRAQQEMWVACHAGVGGLETFNNDCPAGIPAEQAMRAIDRVRNHPEVLPTLTQWTATGAPIVKYLGQLNDHARKSISAIDKTLGTRP